MFTLIDLILTNNFNVDASHTQCIPCSSTSDHYAVFHIAGNTPQNDYIRNMGLKRRDMNHTNITRFTNIIKN